MQVSATCPTGKWSSLKTPSALPNHGPGRSNPIIDVGDVKDSGEATTMEPTTKFSDLNAYLQGVQNRVGTLLQTNALAITAAALGRNLLPIEEKPFCELWAFPVYVAAALLALSIYIAV